MCQERTSITGPSALTAAKGSGGLVKELNVKELPTDGVVPTGEIGVSWMEGRWERNGQRMLCPLSKLVLKENPSIKSFLQAAAFVTGWTIARTLTFKLTMGRAPYFTLSKDSSNEARKGVTDAHLYDLLWKLSRKTHRVGTD
jgi:hypothetical protein